MFCFTESMIQDMYVHDFFLKIHKLNRSLHNLSEPHDSDCES